MKSKYLALVLVSIAWVAYFSIWNAKVMLIKYDDRFGGKVAYYITKYKSYWRFAMVGCSNTAVDFGVFTILRAVFQINYVLCQVAAFTAGILNSFILNKVWTFESKTTHFDTSVQILKFVIVNLVSLGVSLLGLRYLNGNLSMNIYVAKVAVTIVTQVINYSGYRWWVFVDQSYMTGTNS